VRGGTGFPLLGPGGLAEIRSGSARGAILAVTALRRLPVVLAAVALAALSLAAAHLTAGVSGAPRAVAAAKPGPGACGQPCAKRARKQCRSKRGKAKRRCLRRVKRRCAQRHCQAQPKPYRIDGIAYATLLNHFGGWIGPRLASGEPDL